MIENPTTTSLAYFILTLSSSAGANKFQLLFSDMYHPDFNLQDFHTHISDLAYYKEVVKNKSEYFMREALFFISVVSYDVLRGF